MKEWFVDSGFFCYCVFQYHHDWIFFSLISKQSSSIEFQLFIHCTNNRQQRITMAKKITNHHFDQYNVNVYNSRWRWWWWIKWQTNDKIKQKKISFRVLLQGNINIKHNCNINNIIFWSIQSDKWNQPTDFNRKLSFIIIICFLQGKFQNLKK